MVVNKGLHMDLAGREIEPVRSVDFRVRDPKESRVLVWELIGKKGWFWKRLFEAEDLLGISVNMKKKKKELQRRLGTSWCNSIGACLLVRSEFMLKGKTENS